MECLIEAIYFEARSESFDGQIAVANVILNRVSNKKFPRTICEVVHYGHKDWRGLPIRGRCAFSYWCDGKLEKMNDPVAYQEAINAASLVSEGVEILSIKKALHYHAIYVRPYWASEYKRLAQIGKHIFYSRERIN